MRVAQRVDGNATEEIEICAARRIIEATTASVREHNRRTPVRVHEETRFIGANFRGRNTSRIVLLCHAY
jgi:hypothetical protein